MTFALAIACVLVTGNCSPVTAQVAIGGDGTVTPGALLDLSQATNAGGLLLPQIVSADTATAVLKKPGMLVYNKTDGKIYAYNGSAWSAGGGGSEPYPNPWPKTCGGYVKGASGTRYPIGSYPYAQNDLKNLCWTLTNLVEAGASYTSYSGQDNSRGYYYSADVASDPETDICTQKLGGTWRMPNIDDWELLQIGAVDVNYNDLLNNWVYDRPALGGNVQDWAGSYSSGTRYNDWGVASYYRVRDRTDLWRIPMDNLAGANLAAADGLQAGIQMNHFHGNIRCVRDL
jgi:hypothetical protein